MASTRLRRPAFIHLHRAALAAALILAFVAASVTAPAAHAGKGWCRFDPVFIIDGDLVDVWIGSELRALTSVTGPTKLVLTVPSDVDATYVISDLGFGRGYDVSIQQSPGLRKTDRGIEVMVKVYVPAITSDLPITVDFAPRILGLLWPVSAEGTSNSWITLRTSF